MQGSAGLCLVVLVGLWGCVTPGSHKVGGLPLSPVSGGHRSGMRLAASGGGGVGAVRAPAAAAASLYLRGGSDAGGGVETVEKQGRRAALDPTGGLYPLPSFVKHRLAVLERAKARIAAAAAASSCAPSPRHITITLPDGATRNGHAFVTCPSTVANGISKQLALASVVAVVDGNLWDMTRPLEESCALEFLTFDDPRAQKVFWHSSAHILGQALEICKNALLATGPPTEDGFFYDVYLPAQADTPAAELPETRGDSAAATGGDILLDASGRAWDGGPEGRVISSDELPELEQIIANISRQNQAFERVELTKDEALDMFQHNPFKLAIIRDKVPDGATCSAYRCGPLIDLCRGPHLPHSGMVKAVSLTKNSAAYWKGRGDSVVLQRVYGVAFPAKKQLKEHLQWREDAKRRDHRIIGRAQGLFFFHELSPGAAFFLPHGTIIYNRLVEMIRAEYARRNYLEVITPTLFNLKLWQTSGHAEHYRKNMFLLSSGAGKAPPPADKQPSAQGDSAGLGEVASKVRAMGVQWDQDAEGSRTAAVGAEEDTMRCEVRGRAGDGEGAESEEFGLKPMNCPGHCLIFGATVRSYRELPLRLADFGVLHRNEPAGALAGLTRVRRFQQDDAHIFCAPGQVQAEIENVLDFIDEVYARTLSPKPQTVHMDPYTRNPAPWTRSLQHHTSSPRQTVSR
jgi:threonyl-tRNA synthetase